VELLLELDQRLQRALLQVEPPDDRARDVGAFLGDRPADHDGPVGIVHVREVHPPVVTVLVAKRPGDPLHREAI